MVGPLTDLVCRPVADDVQPSGTGDDLAGNEEGDQRVGDAAELAAPGDQVVLVTTVGVAPGIDVVLQHVDAGVDALVGHPLLGVHG